MYKIKTFLIDLKFAPYIGGTATMFRQRASNYAPESIVVLTKSNSESANFDKKQLYKIIRKKFALKGIPGFEWLFTAIQVFFESIGYISFKKFDFIEAARPFPEGFAVFLMGLFLHKKTVLNLHGEDISVMSKYKIEKIALGLMLRHASIVFCNSSFTKTLAIKLFPHLNEKFYIVYPGFTAYHRDSLDINRINNLRASFNGGPILITVARVAERKGHDKVIESLAKITNYFPSVKYVIAGSSTPGEGDEVLIRLQKLATQLNVLNNVIFITNFTDEDKPYLLCAADLFIMPNRELKSGEIEGYGIVFLEASSLGLPVIGGKSGGVVDAIKHQETGLLVDGNQVEEITESILKILMNPDQAKKFGTKGIIFSQNLDSKSVFEQYYSILELKICRNQN